MRHSSFRGRAAAVLVGLMTVAMVGLVALPASAAPPTFVNSLHLDSDNTTPGSAWIGSDRSDGSTPEGMHLTAIGDAATRSIQWFSCDVNSITPGSGGGAGTNPNAAGAPCTSFGTDSTGTEPQPGPTGAVGDQAYDIMVDIPATLDWTIIPGGGFQDLVLWACGTGTAPTNCTSFVEEDVLFDDSSSGGPANQQTSSGEITFPPHGAGIAFDSPLTVTARTSPDVNSVRFCFEWTVDAATEEAACTLTIDDATPNNPVGQQGTFKTWSVTAAGGAHVPDDTFARIAIADLTGGAGLCAGDGTLCQLDSHWVGAQAGEAVRVDLHFPAGSPTFPAPFEDCDVAAAPVTAVQADTDDDVEVQGCAYDQNNNLITDLYDWAFQATPDDTATAGDPAGYDGAGGSSEGDENDTNGNFFFEQVDGDPGDTVDNIAENNFEPQQETTYNLAFCLDSNNDAEDGPGQSATPCEGETLRANGTVTAEAGFSHAHLRFSEDVNQADSQSCNTGDVSKSKPRGANVALAGCAHDPFHNGAADVPVIWRITNGPGQFVSVEQLTDANGFADAVITAPSNIAPGTVTTVNFCLDANNNGVCDADPTDLGLPATQAEIQITWTGTAGGGCIRGTQGPDRLRGTEDNDCIRGRRGDDRLRGLGGKDDLNGQADDDRLNGGPGGDDLTGGRGRDVCRGGAGRDSFAGCEVIKDRQRNV